jgi:hypothetical protein
MSFCHDRRTSLFRTPCVVNSAAILFDANPFLDETFTLTMLAFSILLFDGWDANDAPDFTITFHVGSQEAQQALRVEPIGLGAPGAPIRQNARRLHHMVDHAMPRKKPVQPEDIPSGFETAHDRRFHAQFCRHFLPQIRDQDKQCLGIARLHSMQPVFSLAGILLTTSQVEALSSMAK